MTRFSPALAALIALAALAPAGSAQAPNLTVSGPQPQASCTVFPASACVTYNASDGSYNPTGSNQLTFQVSSTGAPITFTASTKLFVPSGVPSPPTWLSVTPTGPQQTKNSVTVNIDGSPLGTNYGTYLGYLVLTSTGAGNSPYQMAIVLTVFPNASFQAASSTSSTGQPIVQFPGTITGTATDNSIEVTNTGSDVQFRITPSPGANWLTATASNSSTTPSNLSINVNPSGLGAGSYSGLLTLAPDDGSSGALVAVSFTYSPQAYTIMGQVTASGSGLGGVTMTLSGLTSGPTTKTTDSSGSYSFTMVPAGGNYTVTPSLAGYSFSPSSVSFKNLNANQTAPVIIATLNPPTPSISSLIPPSTTAGGPQFQLTVNGSGFVSGAAVHWNPSPLVTQYVNGGQLTATVTQYLIEAQGSAVITVVNPGGVTSSNSATFTITPATPSVSSLSPPSATAQGLGFPLTVNGSGFLPGAMVQWNGSPLSTNYMSGTQLTASVTAALIKDPGTATITVVNPGGATSNAITYTISSPTAPSINAGGVVNAAGYTASVAAVAPGSIAAVFGSFLLTQTMIDTSSPLLDTMLELSLQFGDGSAAPLFFVSGTQVNLQVPWELAGTQTTLAATLGGQSGGAQSVGLAEFAPGIFTQNSQGTGQGSITDPSNHLVDSSNPATAGVTFLQIFCTGLGPVTNTPATGAPASLTSLSPTPTKPTVTIGGVQATDVSFSGLAPGYVGLYQVNAQVPAGVAANDAVPVVISIGGATSNTVTIAVQ